MKNNVLLRHAEPQHGQGKWKSALGCTLLILGMVLMSFGAFAQEPTNGLYMHKTWIPDSTDATGFKGEIMLETFVTGDKIKTEAHIPTDIVVVLDQSGSMAYNMSDGEGGTTTRVEALRKALNIFLDSIQADAKRYEIDHRVAIVGFANDNSTTQSGGRWNNTELLSTAQAQAYAEGNTTTTRLTPAMYQDALQYVNVNNAINPRLTTAVSRVAAQGGTMMQYGLIMANGVLSNRTITQYNAGTEEKPNWIDRTQVVVFFTDGYPGMTNPNNRFAQYNPDYNDANTLYICQTTADATVREARALKNNGAIVFSVGVFDGANPAAAYITTRKNGPTEWQYNQYWQQVPTYYYWEPQNLPSGQDSGDAAANGMMHFISSNYSATETPGNTPWMSLTTSDNNVAGYKNDGKYLSASSASELATIFESIAQESGGAAVDLGSGTVVQDVISPSFQLNIPTGSTPGATIRAYAPKCNGKVGGVFTFEDPTDGATRMTLGTVDGVEGMVIGDDENRLEDGIVDYDSINKTLTFSNFNFKAMYVAQELDDDGNPVLDEHGDPIFFGRKLQMFIPLEVDGGTWGDGIETNGPLSVIQPNGDTINTLPFNIPTANVLGSVWTEVVINRPPNFPEITTGTETVEIGTPEELAWFISEVNGRCGYTHNNTVASHPKLNAVLTADIDMSAHNWVPIGAGYQVEIDPSTGQTRYVTNNGQRVKLTYEGTFDGNGHVITGLKNNASKYYKLVNSNDKNVVVFPGMFSTVSGTVKNVFVLDADFRGKHHNSHFVHHGIIADTLAQSGKIFNCEAAGRITCNNDDPTNDQELIYGGLVGLNEGEIHSCMAMAELTAYTMGGMIGENRGSFSNGFTNGIYNYLDNNITGKYSGGIAATNTGTISNCYVRFERSNKNLSKVSFGQITGNGTFSNAYSPEELTGGVPTSSTAGTRTYKLAEPAQWIRPFYHDNTLDNTRDKMVDKLNEGKGDGASWKRTTAGDYLKSPNGGNINGDYPVLAFDVFGTDSVTCLGSADGIRVDYATSLLDMLHRHNNGNMNDSTHISNEFTQSNPNYYKVSEHEAIYKGTINLYRNDDVRMEEGGSKATVADNCTADSVVVYIDENISLLQDESSTINAFTGQSMTVFNGSHNDTQAGNRWHTVSSSLKNSGFGWSYSADTLPNPQIQHNWDANPCGWRLDQTNDDEDIFPTDLGTYNQTDFYCFLERAYHWINFRRNSVSHWHMDDYSVNIPYPEQEDHFIQGKGYLLAINAAMFDTVQYKGSQLLQNYGELNNGNITIPVTCTSGIEWSGRQGYNLLGNPYQSYLDFDAFVNGNDTLLGNSAYVNTYAVYDPESGAWLQYLAGSSEEGTVSDRYINMHQGFFIQVNASGTAQFTNAMRTNQKGNGFRSTENHYPLINFTLTDSNDNKDIAVLEVGRPENDGAKKIHVSSSNGRLFLRHDNENFAILFRDFTSGTQPLYFEAKEDGVFTLSWNTANANFSSLTLIDNITGVHYDMLAHDSYTFEGSADQYSSRFKVVIGEFTDVEENEETVTENFAFFDGNEWVVNAQGSLVVTDIMGRTVYSTTLTNDQNRVSLNGVSAGVYLMRVSSSNNTMVQKIVVR